MNFLDIFEISLGDWFLSKDLTLSNWCENETLLFGSYRGDILNASLRIIWHFWRIVQELAKSEIWDRPSKCFGRECIFGLTDFKFWREAWKKSILLWNCSWIPLICSFWDFGEFMNLVNCSDNDKDWSTSHSLYHFKAASNLMDKRNGIFEDKWSLAVLTCLPRNLFILAALHTMILRCQSNILMSNQTNSLINHAQQENNFSIGVTLILITWLPDWCYTCIIVIDI